MNRIFRYFDLLSELRSDEREAYAAAGNLHWFPQYVALALGILLQPFFAAYQQTGQWAFGAVWGRLLFASIVGIVVFPVVYKNSFDPAKPIFVQFCIIFTAGMGWETLFATALGATGAPA